MRRLNREVRKRLSFVLAALMLVLSVPQTALSVEAKTGENTGIVSEMTGEYLETQDTPEAEETAEGTEGSTGKGETSESTEGSSGTGETSEGTEGSSGTAEPSESTEGSTGKGETSEDAEGSTETGETSEGAEGSTETGETSEGTEGSSGTGETSEGSEESPESGEITEGSEESSESGEITEGSEEGSETEEISEGESEETLTAVAAEADEQQDITLEVGVKFTVEYDNYNLGFTIREKDYAWYTELSSFTDTSNADTLRYAVTIPSYVRINAERKLPVTEILASVFKGKTKIIKVFFEDDPQLVKINDSAFQNCTKLGYIEIPNTVTSIGKLAFSGDTALGTLYRDKDVDERIDDPRLEIPGSVTTIGEKAFEKCIEYTSLVIPSNLAKVSGSTTPFYNCSKMKDVYFDEGREIIPANLFNGVIGNANDSVTYHIPDSVTTIETNAFQAQTNLVSLKLGNTQITTIGKAAFKDCKKLAYIEWPDTLTYIGESAFSGDTLLGSRDENGDAIGEPCLKFPASVTTIGQVAFEKCNAYKSIEIHPALKKVDGNSIYTIHSPFWNSTGIKDVYFEEGMETIPDNLFNGVIGNKDDLVTFHMADSITTIGKNTFGTQTYLTRVEFGEDTQLTTIGESAFKNCANLTYIDFPNTLTKICAEAFSGDKLLGSRDKEGNEVIDPCLTFPASVTTIGQLAFEKCNSYTSIFIPITLKKVADNGIYTIHSPFMNAEGIKDVYFEEGIETILSNLFNGVIGNKNDLVTVHMADSITTIGKGAFGTQTYLTRVEFGKDTQLTTIGESAFKGCANLTYIDFPNTLTKIGAEAFSGDILLGSRDKEGNEVVDPCLKFPASVTTIGQLAFEKCNSYTSVFIPITLKKVADNGIYTVHSPFMNAAGIKDIYIEEGIETILPNLFHGVIGKDSVNFHIPNSVTTIGDSAFDSQTNLTRFEMGESSGLTTIGSSAFAGCSALQFVNLPDSVTKIGGGAFSNCKALETISLPDSITTIGEYAFDGCKALKSVRLPDALTKMERGFFRNNTKLEEVILGENTKLATIGENAFEKCTSLSSFTFPATLKTIWHEAFTGCSALTEVVIPVSVTQIYTGAFNGCTSLQSVEFEVNNFYTHTQSIGQETFKGCTSLKTVKFGNKVKTISKGMFSGCKTLEELEIPYGVQTVEADVFYNCNALRALFIPSSVTTIKTKQSELAFCYQQGLKIYVEKGESAAVNFAAKYDFETEIGIYNTSVEFPDRVLYQQMLMQPFDRNLDTRLTLRELEKIVDVDLSGLGIADMTGTQLFTSMENLDCSNNEIRELDTEAWALLKTLNCADNKIAKLDVSQNALLESLGCGNNKLAAIKMAGNQAVTALEGGNQNIAIVKTIEKGKVVLDIKAYDEAYDHACVTNVAAYLNAAEIQNANVEISEKGFVLPVEADRVVYQYTIPNLSSMIVTVDIFNSEEELPDDKDEDKDKDKNKKDIATLSISAFLDRMYTGEEITQTITIYDETYLLAENRDYTAKYENNVEVGTAGVIIEGIGKYTGTYKGSYEIKPEWKAVTVKNIPNQIFQDKEIEPRPSVMLGKRMLAEGSDFTVSYLDNKYTGAATVMITGKGQYADSGMKEVAFNIVECNISKVGMEPIADEVYDKTAKRPLPALHYNGSVLKAGTDYVITYSNNVKAGKGIITITGKGNYTGTVKRTFKINKYDLSNLKGDEISVEEKVPFSMTGARAAVVVKTASGITLTEGVDYTLSYSGNKKAGTTDAKVVIKGKGSCSGMKQMTFEVEAQDIKDSSIYIQVAVGQRDAKGRQIKPKVTITQNNKRLREGENNDYTIAYNAEETVNTGRITVKIAGRNNYTGEAEADFVIVDKLISKAKISGLRNFEYDGGEKEQSENDITVMVGNEKVPSNCYQITYDNNVNAGNKAAMIVTAIPENCNYEFGGSVIARFKITPIKFLRSKIEKRVEARFVEDRVIYNGEKQFPEVIVIDKDRDITLSEGEDYTLVYSNNQKAGTKGKIKIKGIGNYSGAITLPLRIETKNMAEHEGDFTVIAKNSAYSGKNIIPRITVMDGDNLLKLNRDYKLIVTKLRNPNVSGVKVKDKGGYTITIQGVGNYSGELPKYRIYVY